MQKQEFNGMLWKKELHTVVLSKACKELTLTDRMAHWYTYHHIPLVCRYCNKALEVGDRLFTGKKTRTRSYLLLAHKSCRDRLYQ